MENLVLIIGLTFDVIGKVVLGIMVILVHTRIAKEHRIDRAVLTEIRREWWLGIFGVALMIIGYILEVVFYMTGPFI